MHLVVASMRPRLLHLGYVGVVLAGVGHRRCFNEAEAFTPRILLFPDDLRALGKDASMRPRLLHLGYSRLRPSLIRPRWASMRPRLLHLGYEGLGQHGPGEAHGFNEAEAFTPRIRHHHGRPQAEGVCFNEAEAFTPRIRPRRSACHTI